jgi:hypothetical protein
MEDWFANFTVPTDETDQHGSPQSQAREDRHLNGESVNHVGSPPSVPAARSPAQRYSVSASSGEP